MDQLLCRGLIPHEALGDAEERPGVTLDQGRKRCPIAGAQPNEQAGVGVIDGLGSGRHPQVRAIMALPVVETGP